jgi:hypothetical protein
MIVFLQKLISRSVNSTVLWNTNFFFFFPFFFFAISHYWTMFCATRTQYTSSFFQIYLNFNFPSTSLSPTFFFPWVFRLQLCVHFSSLQFVPHFPSIIQSVPLATEPGISIIILTPMKILQPNLNSTCYDVVTFLTQWGKSASNFLAISSLVVKLLKECRVR